jgi:histidine triad (HIT) family protein
MTAPTVFTRILNGEIPGEIVAETERVFAITDIKTEQYENVAELAAGDPSLLAEVIDVARKVAAEKADGEFRLIFNTGAGAGQTVFHVHAHVLAGNLEERALVG